MKAFICNSIVPGIAGYGPHLGFIIVVFKFHSISSEWKTTGELEIKFNVVSVTGSLFSQLGSCVIHGRDSSSVSKTKIQQSSPSQPAIKDISLCRNVRKYVWRSNVTNKYIIFILL